MYGRTRSGILPHPTSLREATPDQVRGRPFSRQREKGSRCIYLSIFCFGITWAALAALLLATTPAAALQPPPAARTAIAQGLPLTPQMFGAKGDGRSDDTEAVATWLGSGQPLFCAGTFKINHEIAVRLPPDGGLSLQGAGRQLCKLVLATPLARLAIAGGTPDLYRTPQVVIHDLSLAPAVTLAGPALTIAFTGGSGATDPTLDLRNIAVKPTASDVYAPTCIRLDNVRNGVAEAINCEGRRDDYVLGTRGIVVTGDAQPVELTLRDVNAYFVETGIALEGTWQGVAISESTCVMCRVGVHAAASDDAGVWLRVLDSHFNVTDAGIEAINIANVNATGNFVYLDAVGASRAPFRACVALTMISAATAWAKVDGNACDGTQTKASPTYGVYLDSKRPPSRFLMESRIDGNSFYTLDWGVYLGNATAVAIGANTFSEMAKGDIWNGSSGEGRFRNTRTPPDVPLTPGAN